jgi:hypothetical protein
MTLQDRLDNIQLHFIVGIGRSGSTLLTALLNENENCISTPEIHHFIKFFKKYKNISLISRQVIDDYKCYIELYFKYKKNPLIGPQNYTLINSLKIGDQITYAQLTKLVYLGLYGEKGIINDVRVIVDKNPYYTLQLREINQVFPDAKYIALIRDYRGFLLSNLQSKKIGTFRKSVCYYALAWNLFISEIITYKTLFKNRLKIVKYEDLVSNKELVVKEVFEFLNVPFNPSVFDFHKAMQGRLALLHSSDNNYERMLNKISNLNNPISQKRVFEWQTKLTAKQIMTCDILCANHGVKLGYEKITEFTPINKLVVFIKAIPSYVKVKIFEWMRSPELHFYYQYKIRK